jgi:hypothetical protein
VASANAAVEEIASATAKAGGFQVEVGFLDPVRPTLFIELKGLDYGFIGGASGLISPNLLAFAGDITAHPDFDKIEKFLFKNGINIKILDDGPLMDIGTITIIKEYCI